MKPTKYFFALLLSGIAFISCSTSKESTTNEMKKEPEILVFDEVKQPDSVKVEIPKPAETEPAVKPPEMVKETIKPVTKKFILQVGAFTTQERAQIFVKENQPKIAYLMSITLRESDKYYVVRLQPFETRENAETVRNSIWQIPAFKDAFIITLE